MKATAHTAKIVARSGIGTKPERELTEADHATAEARKAEQAERLARIAARQKSAEIATPTTVAQAISRVIDEQQEFGGKYEPFGLYLNEDDGNLRINEVGAQLHHLLGGNVEFEVKTSDGRTFTVRVSESA